MTCLFELRDNPVCHRTNVCFHLRPSSSNMFSICLTYITIRILHVNVPSNQSLRRSAKAARTIMRHLMRKNIAINAKMLATSRALVPRAFACSTSSLRYCTRSGFRTIHQFLLFFSALLIVCCKNSWKRCQAGKAFHGSFSSCFLPCHFFVVL